MKKTPEKTEKPKSSPDNSVRRRVQRHLKHLLIPGLLSVGACKSRNEVVCDPLPPPIEATSNGAPPDAGPPPPVVCDPLPPPPLPLDADTPGPDAGPPPVVCDPLPPPQRDAGTRPPVVCDPLPPPPRDAGSSRQDVHPHVFRDPAPHPFRHPPEPDASTPPLEPDGATPEPPVVCDPLPAPPRKK